MCYLKILSILLHSKNTCYLAVVWQRFVQHMSARRVVIPARSGLANVLDVMNGTR